VMPSTGSCPAGLGPGCRSSELAACPIRRTFASSRSTTSPSPSSSQNESGDRVARAAIALHRCRFDRRMKVKGPGTNFWVDFARRIGRGRCSEAADRLLWRWFRLGDGRSAQIRLFRGHAPSPSAAAGGWRSICWVVGCGWARVDDVSKRRRLGARGLPRDVALRGPCYARPGVTLAPALPVRGAVACQSETIRT